MPDPVAGPRGAGSGQSDRAPLAARDAAARLVTELSGRGQTIALAESLTGGLLAAELIAIPGASAVVSGGVVAYNTAIKHSVLGVDAALLAERGAVDAEVARQMADRARAALAVNGRGADYGLATTGVAGPDPQDGKQPGTVYVGVATPQGVSAHRLSLDGDRAAIRTATVRHALALLLAEIPPAASARQPDGE